MTSHQTANATRIARADEDQARGRRGGARGRGRARRGRAADRAADDVADADPDRGRAPPRDRENSRLSGDGPAGAGRRRAAAGAGRVEADRGLAGADLLERLVGEVPDRLARGTRRCGRTGRHAREATHTSPTSPARHTGLFRSKLPRSALARVAAASASGAGSAPSQRRMALALGGASLSGGGGPAPSSGARPRPPRPPLRRTAQLSVSMLEGRPSLRSAFAAVGGWLCGLCGVTSGGLGRLADTGRVDRAAAARVLGVESRLLACSG